MVPYQRQYMPVKSIRRNINLDKFISSGRGIRTGGPLSSILFSWWIEPLGQMEKQNGHGKEILTPWR